MHKEFWENKYRIFGIYPINSDGTCSCGNPECTAAGKHPVVSRWSQIPLWSEEQLEAGEQAGQFDAGYGVLCKGLLVIDIDARNGGIDSYAKLCADIPEVQQAGLIVDTGSGGGSKHLYFSIDPKIALVSHLDRYPGIDFKSGSTYVVGPDSMHKSGNRYKAVFGSPDDIEPAPGSLIEALKKPEYHRSEYGGETLDLTDADLVELLGYVNPDCYYEQWIRCGMAVHEATQGGGFNIWLEWSDKGTKFPGVEELQKHWHSFGKATNPVTIGTLMHYAHEGGYVAPVTFTEEKVAQDSQSDFPFPIGDIDLLRPPGLVGRLTEWINSQCRYPREHLAVAGALTSMCNIAGLRYTDDKDRVSLNLLSLCVAGSATGKEAILQSVVAIHEAVRLQPAIVGNIKSEQEIVRNLVRHQAAYYLIDEVGYLLQKIESARQKGGSAYLDGIIATIMAVYSKADGSFLVSGDLKDAVAAELKKELAQCYKKVEENEDKNGYYERRAKSIQEVALPQIELGLERPFLSMMGMTTPVSFDGLVTVEQATNGFIGRCMLVREPETNPARKRGFRQPSRKLPDNLMMALSQIYSPGSAEIDDPMRIEFHGEKVQIKTTDQAIDMLEDAADWLEEFAEKHKGRTGLEAVIRRSYELMAKISTLLAIGDGVRTEEHVRWAFAFMCRDMEAKIRLAQTNITEGSEEALKNRILDAAGEGEKEGVILQRVASKKYSKPDIKKALVNMVESGELIVDEKAHPVNGLVFSVYKPANLG